MEVSLLGMKINLVCVAISLLIGAIIGMTTLCSCSVIVKKDKEGFANKNLTNKMGAALNYKPSEGVPGNTWAASHTSNKNSEKSMYASLEGNVAGPVPPSDDQLFLFAGNKFSPDCCYKPNQYSSSTGCACISVDQMKFINSRGGNNTLPESSQ